MAIRKTEQATPLESAPASQEDCARALWLGDAMRVLGKILRNDQRMADDAQDAILAKIAARIWAGNQIDAASGNKLGSAMRILSRVAMDDADADNIRVKTHSEPVYILDDGDRERIAELIERRRGIRDALAKRWQKTEAETCCGFHDRVVREMKRAYIARVLVEVGAIMAYGMVARGAA